MKRWKFFQLTAICVALTLVLGACGDDIEDIITPASTKLRVRHDGNCRFSVAEHRGFPFLIFPGCGCKKPSSRVY